MDNYAEICNKIDYVLENFDKSTSVINTSTATRNLIEVLLNSFFIRTQFLRLRTIPIQPDVSKKNRFSQTTSRRLSKPQ